MRRWAILLIEAIGWVLLAVVALVGSVLVHIDTPVGHRVVRNLTNGLVTDLIAGRLEIGRVDHVGLDEIRVAHVSLYDRQGVKVIQADRIELVIDPIAGLRGELRFSHAELYHAFLRLDTTTEGDITFLDALGERVPTPPSKNPLHAFVEDMHLHDVTAYGYFLGLHGLRAEDLEVHMRLEFTDDTKVQIFSGRGKIVAPFPFLGELDACTADIRGDAHRGILVNARAHTGDNRVQVRVLYRVPTTRPETDPSELDLLIHADPVDAPKLVEGGFDWADLFIGRARGYVRLYGPTDDLRLSAELSHDAGEVTLRGNLPSEGDVRIQAITPGVDLTRLFASAPEARVGGNVTLIIPEDETEPPRLHANTLPFVYEGYQVPAADLDANLEDERARVLDLRAPYGGGILHGWGIVGYDGSFDVTVKGSVAQVAHDPNVQRHAEGARGALSVTAHVRADASDHYVVDAEGGFTDLSYANVTATHTLFTAHTATTAHGTQVRVDADAHGARVFDTPIGDGHIGVTGLGDVFDFELGFAGEEQSTLRARGRVALRGRGYRVDVPVAEISRHGIFWLGSAEGLEYDPGRRIALGHIHAAQHGGSPEAQPQLYAEGVWLARGEDELRLEARGIDLAMLRAMFAPTSPSIAGIADLRADVSGDIDTHPIFSVDGLIYGGEFHGVRDVDVAFYAGYDGTSLSTDVQLDLDDGGRLMLAGEGRFVGSVHDFVSAAQVGDYDMTLTADRVDLARLAPLFGEAGEGVGGRAQGSLHATGSLFLQPNFQGRLSIPALTLPGFQTLDVDVETQYQLGSLAVHAVTSDSHGTLVEGDGSVQIDVAEALRNPRNAIASLALMPWRFSLRLPPRLASELPARFSDRLPEIAREFRVAASLSLAGGGIRTRGSLIASFEHESNPERFVCARETHPRGHIVASLENDVTRATVTALVANDAAARMEISARTPLDDWLFAAVQPAMPPVNVDVSLDSADLANVPYFCENFRGPLSGEVAVHGLFTDSPTIAGTLESGELRVRRVERSYVGALHVAVEDTPPIRVALSLSADSQQATVDGSVHFPRFGVTGEDPSTEGDASEPCTPDSHDCTSLHGDVAWSWNSASPMPRVDDTAPIDLRATAERMPLQLPLAFISFFGRADGVIDGTIAATGTVAEPVLDGRLVISDGKVDLRSLGQRLRDVHGEMILQAGRLELRDFEARDGDGRMAVTGNIGLRGFSPENMHLDLNARAFPVRNDSAIVATLSGHGTLDSTLVPNGMDGAVRLENLDVRMPSETQREPMGLSGHPDVYIHARAAGVEEDEGPPYRIHMALDASRPFWVRSRDFSAQVSAQLEILYADPEFRVSGTADIRRGFFEVMGKRFNVEQASLAFGGGPTIDPDVNLVATTQLRGGANNTITVRAGGTLSNPQITFSSPLVPSGDQGQIICLLMAGSSTGQCGEAQGQTSAANTFDASQQAASFLTGVAFGLLTLSLREQFGAFIPMIAIESGNTGLQSARVRAGFNANALIPKRLRSVVQGMYIEGFFSVGSQTGTGINQAAMTSNVVTSQSVGFSMELQFPHNLVGAGAVAPPNNFSLDVTWQP